MLKSTKTLASEKKRKLSMACQQQRRTQSPPRNLTQRRTQPQQQPQPPPQTRQKPPPQPRQQHPPQPNHAMVSPTRAKMCEEGQDVFSSLVKKTRGITRGVGTHAVINASEKRIPIQMNHEQKLPRNIKANAMFSSAIGSFTRKHAPLIVKTWKKVSDKDKTSIITALTTQFDFDYTDPSIRKHIEDHMAKSYGQWKCKLHKHFKNHANDLEYARAHPPSEKLWGKRQMAEWEWLCDELWTKEDYQKRCKINANNRGKLKYNHCGGSRPFQKHMEASQEKGENVTIVENWGIMHQHQGGLGTWVNEEAEAIGKKMLDELQKEKQKLAEMQDTSIDKISVPISTQLEILTKEVGVMKGKTIRGLGYGPQRETICNHANHSKTDMYTTEELLSAMGQMALQIEQLEAKFAAYVKQNTSPPCDDGIGEDDEESDGDDPCDDGIGEDDEEMDEEDEEEDLGYMH